MATTQITDLFLNNQKRTSEGAVATFPAKLGEGNTRLGTGASYIVAGDTYNAFSIPKNSVVSRAWAYVREAFVSGTTASISTSSGTSIAVDLDVTSKGSFVILADGTGEPLEFGAFFDTADGFAVTFNKTSQGGALQIIAEYVSVDDKSGKYVASI